MRRRGKVDANQGEIVAALRKAGAHVQSLADIGKGCPDLLVSYDNRWHVMEIKDGSKPPSQRKLTEDEAAWIDKAQASVWIVTDVAGALGVIGATGE